MIISHYKETFEVLLDYPRIGGEDIKYYFDKAISNILHVNIDVHIRRLISESPGYEIIYFSKLRSHFANMNFSDESINDRL